MMKTDREPNGEHSTVLRAHLMKTLFCNHHRRDEDRTMTETGREEEEGEFQEWPDALRERERQRERENTISIIIGWILTSGIYHLHNTTEKLIRCTEHDTLCKPVMFF